MEGWIGTCLRRRITALACAIACVAIATPTLVASAAGAGSGDWAMFMFGPGHNGDNRAEHTLSPSTVSTLHVTRAYADWQGSQPLVVGGMGFGTIGGSGNKTFVAAFNLSSGNLVWRHLISRAGGPAGLAPAVSNGILYVGGDADMYAFNAADGRAVWATPVPHTSNGAGFNQVTVDNGVVYAATYWTNTIYAFNASTGHVLWSVNPPGCCLLGAVTIGSGLAYVSTNGGTTHGALIAYKTSSGAHAFTSAAAGSGDTVAIDGGVVFLMSGNHLQAFNAMTGALLWSAATETGNQISGTPAVDAGTVVVTTTRYVIGFAASTGTRLWTVDSGSDNTYYDIPVIANGVVYASGGLGTTSELQALDEGTGHVLFSGGSGCGGLIVSHGALYVPCYPGGMSVFTP